MKRSVIATILLSGALIAGGAAPASAEVGAPTSVRPVVGSADLEWLGGGYCNTTCYYYGPLGVIFGSLAEVGRMLNLGSSALGSAG
ncbi:hypothetical protein [Nocardia lasii]|uniref:Porin n=1 Tax=Nocardia lasii TaxID=1616107 RepID=A0ABW1JXH6_9NOCA